MGKKLKSRVAGAIAKSLHENRARIRSSNRIEVVSAKSRGDEVRLEILQTLCHEGGEEEHFPRCFRIKVEDIDEEPLTLPDPSYMDPDYVARHTVEFKYWNHRGSVEWRRVMVYVKTLRFASYMWLDGNPMKLQFDGWDFGREGVRTFCLERITDWKLREDGPCQPKNEKCLKVSTP